jgi:hypothetical protein
VTELLDLVIQSITSVRVQDPDSLFVRPLSPKAVLVLPGSRVLVSVSQLVSDWNIYRKQECPSPRKLSATLSSLSIDGESVSLSLSTSQNKHNYWEISPDILREHIRRANQDDPSNWKRHEVYYDASVRNAKYQPTARDAERREKAIEYLSNLAVEMKDEAAE